MTETEQREIGERIEQIKAEIAAIKPDDPAGSRLRSVLSYQVQNLQARLDGNSAPPFPTNH